MEDIATTRDIAQLSYGERQFITLRGASIFPLRRATVSDQPAETAARHALVAVRMAATSGAALVSRVITEAGKRRKRLPLLRVTSIEAQPLDFPHGHPRVRVVYAGHPVPGKAHTYYPVADFHKQTFEHKFTEVLRLLTALGAVQIDVSAKEGWRRALSTKIHVPGLEEKDGAMLSAEAGATSGKHGELLYRATLPGNTSRFVPDDLSWFPTEATWVEMARQRTDHWLKDFHLEVNYRDDFGVTTEIASKLVKKGFGLGGEFERKVNTTWSVSGSFSVPAGS